MARFDPARLGDIAAVLDEVRSWPETEERSPGTFYVRRQPFLHFHVGRDTRRADVKGEDWIEVELPEPAPAAARRRFERVLRDEYRRRCG